MKLGIFAECRGLKLRVVTKYRELNSAYWSSVGHSLEFKYLGAFESFRIALGHEMGRQVAWFLETSSKQKYPM
jgi:hypothetical protein